MTDGYGNWILDANGQVFASGDAPSDGVMSATHLNGFDHRGHWF
jgi:hypothetical protein